MKNNWEEKPIPKNVKIGKESWLFSSYAFSHYKSTRPLGVRIGHNTGVDVGLFDLGKNAELEIGNYCTLVQPIINTDKKVVIGDYVLIAAAVIIADSPFLVPHEDSKEKSKKGEPEISVKIGSNVWISSNALILEGADIGDNSIIGARTIIDFKVPKNSIVVGNPARILKNDKK